MGGRGGIREGGGKARRGKREERKGKEKKVETSTARLTRFGKTWLNSGNRDSYVLL